MLQALGRETRYTRLCKEARSTTDPAMERSEKFRRIEALNIGVDTQFLVDYAYWLPWDEIRPGGRP